ncbi:MAG: flagellar hook-basal body complex protein FliE [Phycisphaerales bacterium]|nr:flagellar hook-basal body complex protein FliE [Phycisphaerales bacterium]
MPDPLGLIQSAGASPIQRPVQPAAGTEAGGVGAFKDMLLDQLREVNRLEQETTQAVEDLATGQRNDPDAVFAAQRKADIAFQMLLQVRNKVMDAYNEMKQIRV